jgi:MFS family permease
VTPSRVARVVFSLIIGSVLAGAGSYLLVYLYRWEWNRALISGLFFLIAEVALVGVLLARRLSSIERRLDERGTTPITGAPPAHPSDAPTFPWLQPGSLGVFVPVLLGVGAILSVLAYAVERLGAATARGDRIDGRLAAIALPGTDLQGRRTATPAPPAPARTSRRSGAVTAVVATVAITGTVLLLSSIATYRDPPDPVSGTTTIVLQVDARSGSPDAEAVANTLWMACRGNVDDGVGLVSVEPLVAGVARVTVAPRVAVPDERRFLGCLEDLRFDGVRIEVRAVSTEPAADV